MAQIGTDIIETITAAGAPFVAPVAMTLVGFSPSMATAPTAAGARTITVSKNGTPLGQTGSVAQGASPAVGTTVTLTTPVSLAVGDYVTVAGSGGTGGTVETAALWLQRA